MSVTAIRTSPYENTRRNVTALEALPANLEVERLVLGALLSGNRQEITPDLLIQSLQQSDFSIERHKLILERMRDIQERGGYIDTVTVARELQKHGQLELVGGVSYLASLCDGMPTLVGMESRIGILREEARLRAILGELEEARGQALARIDSRAIVERLRTIGEKVADLPDGDEPETIEKIIELASVDGLLTQKNAPGIEPFIPWLGEQLRFTPNSLTIVAARPSVGKSAFAQQQAWESAIRSYLTDFYTLEVTKADNIRRIVGQQAQVNMRRIKTGAADQDERFAAQAVLGKLAANPNIRFQDKGNLTIPDIIRSLYRAIMRGSPVQFLIVDFMQLMTAVGRYSNEVQAMTSISRGLKLIAQSFNIAVLGLSQMSREVEKQMRKPRLSDLRESGSLEQDADNVIFLHRLGADDTSAPFQRVLLMLAKNKDGPIGECELTFTKRYARFDQAYV